MQFPQLVVFGGKLELLKFSQPIMPGALKLITGTVPGVIPPTPGSRMVGGEVFCTPSPILDPVTHWQ
jgi:hypothetical protein